MKPSWNSCAVSAISMVAGILLALGGCSSGGSETPPAAPPASVTLTIAKAGNGTGTITSNPAVINCGATCTLTASSGTVLTLIATPAQNNTLSDWGGACAIASATCAITMTADQTVTTTFSTSTATPTLTITPAGTGNGSVRCNGVVCNPNYPWGSIVTLSSVPQAGSSFAGWSGNGCTGIADCIVHLWDDQAITPTFNIIPGTARLSITKTGTSTGSVSSSPSGIDCGTICSANFPGGATVTLYASVPPITMATTQATTFSGWSGGGCSGTGICDVTLNTDTVIGAAFNLSDLTLTVTTIGTGNGTVTCNGEACKQSYPAGTTVTLVAVPATTSIFSGWDGACAGAGLVTTCTLNRNDHFSVSARFSRPELSVLVAGTGMVTSTPNGINCGTSCSASFNNGTSVTLTPTGNGFHGWIGGGCSGTGTCVVTLSQEVTTVAASFAVSGLTCPAAPTLVKDILPGNLSGFIGFLANSLVNVNGTLFFKVNDGIHGTELWKSDGTDAGTLLVKDIGPGNDPNPLPYRVPQFLTNVNGTLFFIMDDGVHGLELWKSDGTEAGTVLVKDILPGPGSGFDQNLTDSLVAVNNTLFFTANNGVNGLELWRSDGTEPGTVIVRDINPNGSSFPVLPTDVNGTLYFGATDGVTGTELWKSDGTIAGTVLVKDIQPGSGTSLNIIPDSMVNVNGTVFFTASTSSSYQLWKSDGTATGTVLVKDIAPSDLTNVNGMLYFLVRPPSGAADLWKSDGTTLGTVLVKAGLLDPQGLLSVGNRLFFGVNQGDIYGARLWTSDGTAAGTVALLLPDNVYPTGSLFLYPSAKDGDIADVNGTAFFNGYKVSGPWGPVLWKSDGTEAGTARVEDITPGFTSNPVDLTNINGTLFFVASSQATGYELWSVCGIP
jgi:ELWxxDGT repeat protein